MTAMAAMLSSRPVDMPVYLLENMKAFRRALHLCKTGRTSQGLGDGVLVYEVTQRPLLTLEMIRNYDLHPRWI